MGWRKEPWKADQMAGHSEMWGRRMAATTAVTMAALKEPTSGSCWVLLSARHLGHSWGGPLADWWDSLTAKLKVRHSESSLAAHSALRMDAQRAHRSELLLADPMGAWTAETWALRWAHMTE